MSSQFKMRLINRKLLMISKESLANPERKAELTMEFNRWIMKFINARGW